MKQVLNEWYPILKEEMEKDYFPLLVSRVSAVPEQELCPPRHRVFRIYQAVPPGKVKVVILGLDPYIKGEACGFSFSTERGNMPPSLRVIRTAILKETGQRLTDGNLQSWVDQGVFLLNTILTTERGKTLAHGKWGWQNFTGATLKYLASSPQPMVFMVWGNEALKSMEEYIRPYLSGPKLVLENCHPMAENYGRYKFSDKGHFTAANDFLIRHGKTPILWALNSAQTSQS